MSDENNDGRATFIRYCTRRGIPTIEEYNTLTAAVTTAYWESMAGVFTKRIEAPDGTPVFEADRFGYGIRQFAEEQGFINDGGT